jgi:CRP/FNR family transcriptional regulator
MLGPYGFDSNENCQTCKLRTNGFFCNLTPEATKDFNAIKSLGTYPAGATLFMEKQDFRGVFVLCAGEVKLSVSSSAGKTLILRIARPGEILGLMAAMSGTPYEVTAETVHPCQVAFIRRDDFTRFMTKHPEVYQGAAKQLSTLYGGACEQLRNVGLSASAPEKLARLLVGWSAEAKETKQGRQIKMPLTHEEIAEFIGSTRETVTRILSEFKNQHLVTLEGSTMMIANRPALQTIGGD